MSCSSADLQIKTSIQNNEYLDLLCQGLVGKSGLKVTPAMRARIAFVRFTYAHNPDQTGNGFWDFVDEELKKLHTNANGSADHLQYCMNNYAHGDETTYKVGAPEPGQPVKYKVVTDESKLPDFQRAIAKAAAGFVPMVSGASAGPAGAGSAAAS
ncbi:hypothetical protein AURDEDRAFT_170799 [Auricularia subglabra TFB-10046 SS5]|nr:hypothetical protein AURDEDRAFT_170799 [Auricularia subglabra TFB-10046 SS5]